MNPTPWIRRALLLGALGAALVAADTPNVQELMTPEEFQASGLAKLSPSELDALNAWLLRYTAHEAPIVRKTSPEVKREAVDTPSPTIHSQIDGAFTGWNGKTLFRLKNGQVWKQRLSGTYRTKLTDPEVEIYQKYFGLYWMKIVETGRSVGVAPAE